MNTQAAKIRAILTIILMFIVTACTQAESNPMIEPADEQSVTVAPVILFEGEERKYEPFFGYMTGAVKIDYTGSKQVLELGSEVWRDGKKIEELGGSAIFFDEEQMKEGYHGELIINMKERVIKNKGAELDIMMSMNANTGSSAVSYPISWDPALKAKSIITHHDPVTYSIEDKVPIWGIQATSTDSIQPTDFTPEYLARTEYALIFTIRFLDRSDYDSSR